jgi:hypothetical protein
VLFSNMNFHRDDDANDSYQNGIYVNGCSNIHFILSEPNTPGRFIVWYRNETTLLVLWQPPYPAGVFSGYKVQIEPRDAIESVLNVPKEGDPPGPAQAAFNNLVPGRAYNISVETVSEDQISTPTTAQYRTVPLRPGNITFDTGQITPTSFQVMWYPPTGYRLVLVLRIRNAEFFIPSFKL